MRRLVLPVALASLLALPAAAGAATKEYGSDLTATASVTQSHPRDWAAWPQAVPPGGTSHVADVEGEVTSVTFKGTIPQRNSFPDFHVNVAVLRAKAGGAYQVVLASDFLDYSRLVGGDSQRKTTFDLKTESNRVCVEPGDIVTVATSGGFGTDPFFDDGVPMEIFAATPGASVNFSESDNGNGFEGTAPAPRTQAGTELLMRYTVSTGDDARPFCRSDAENQNPTVEFAQPSTELASSGGKVPFGLRCASVRACEGTLYIKLPTGVIGEGKFTLGGGAAGTVNVVLSANGQRKLSESGGRLPVTVLAKVAGGAAVEKDGFVITGGGGPDGGGDSIATPVKPKAALPVKGGKVTLTVRCEGSAVCAGKLALSKVGTFFGSAAFSVPGGSARAVAVKLNADAKRALRRATGRTISAKAIAKTASGDRSVIFKIKR